MIELFAGAGPRLFLDENSALDIAGCVVEGVDISPGNAVPDDGDARIFRSVQGFLFSCGPDHIRHPSPIPGDPAGRRFPLHGSAAGHRAQVLSLESNEAEASCTAEIDITTAEGGQARLRRRWRIDSAAGMVRLADEIVNVGKDAWPVFWMYHMNIGGRFFDEQTRLEGAMLEGGGFGWRFGQGPGQIFCVPAAEGGAGEYEVRLGPLVAPVGKILTVRVLADTLPYLQVWRNQNAPVDVFGIEPVSHRWVDREVLEAAGEFDMLAPGQSRRFGLSFAFL